MIDFAGSGVVHVTGGITALIATKILGPRKGRFFDDRGIKLERPKSFPGHSKSLQVRIRELINLHLITLTLSLTVSVLDARNPHFMVWMVWV